MARKTSSQLGCLPTVLDEDASSGAVESDREIDQGLRSFSVSDWGSLAFGLRVIERKVGFGMSSSPRVLLVDDEPDFVANLVDILVDAGFCVDSTTDPALALDLIRAHRYDAAILDWRMPSLDGVRLQALLREAQQDLATILLTAYADAETHLAAQQAGFWWILEKPCDVPKIQTLLEGMTQRPRLLVVDDEAEFCRGLVDVLHQHRVRAAYCTSVSEGIQALSERDWDIVLLDLKLPAESPRDLVEFLAENDRKTAVVVVTGQDELGQEWMQLKQMGVDRLWQKPLDIPGLIARLPFHSPQGSSTHDRS